MDLEFPKIVTASIHDHVVVAVEAVLLSQSQLSTPQIYLQSCWNQQYHFLPLKVEY